MEEIEQPPQPDFEQFRQHVHNSINGDLGDEAQEAMIISLFEGQLKHQMNILTVWAGNGVGTMRDKSGVLTWS